MSQPTGYDIKSYGEMITDKARIESHVQALRTAIYPGSTLVDIGAGTGIFSVLACQMGTEHVDAIEPHDAISVAKAIAAANGYADRITFHQELSTSVNLLEQTDIIVSDLRGILPLHQQHIPAIIDARERFLKPGGCMIPEVDILIGALVETPKIYKHYEQPWSFNDYGLDMSDGHKPVVNSWQKVSLEETQLLVAPQVLATLDYRTITSPDVDGTLSWIMENQGIAHGVAVWFDAQLTGDIGFSNAPGQPELIYGQAFFPLQNPVQLGPGDQVVIRLRANLVGDDYIWRWDTRINAPGKPDTPTADYKQSTFYGGVVSHQNLRKKASAYVPDLKEEGRINRIILDSMDGDTTLEDIARKIAKLFPDQYQDWKQALAKVGTLSEKYS